MDWWYFCNISIASVVRIKCLFFDVGNNPSIENPFACATNKKLVQIRCNTTDHSNTTASKQIDSTHNKTVIIDDPTTNSSCGIIEFVRRMHIYFAKCEDYNLSLKKEEEDSTVLLEE